VNYHYRATELAAQLRLLAPAVVFYDAHDTDTIAAARAAVPEIRRWCAVAGDDDPAAPGALTVDRFAAADTGSWYPAGSPDDVLIKCTGGTTGAPLALRWRIGDILRQLNDHNPWLRHDLRQPSSSPPPATSRPPADSRSAATPRCFAPTAARLRPATSVTSVWPGPTLRDCTPEASCRQTGSSTTPAAGTCSPATGSSSPPTASS